MIAIPATILSALVAKKASTGSLTVFHFASILLTVHRISLVEMTVAKAPPIIA